MFHRPFFTDRQDAGRQLGEALRQYVSETTLILAIPKGGIPVAAAAAEQLNVPFTVLISRKLPLPYNPEAGFGAINEDGASYIFPHAEMEFTREQIDTIIEQQYREIQRRIELLRAGQPLPDLKDRSVILIDDGIAMGSTMRVSVAFCRGREVREIIVAAPVGSPRVAGEMQRLADHAVILHSPPGFRAVADAYSEWHDVTDEEALEFLEGGT